MNGIFRKNTMMNLHRKQERSRHSHYIVVDLREIITYLCKLNTVYDFYKRYPVVDIITTVLSLSPYIGCDELFNIEIENRFEGMEDQLDIVAVDALLSTVIQIVDEELVRHFPKGEDFRDYVLHKWINPTTVILVNNPVNF